MCRTRQRHDGEAPEWAIRMETSILQLTRKVDKLMALVEIEQGDIDAVAASLETLVTAVQGIPSGTLPAANETALNQAVTDLQNAVATATNPPAPTPPAGP